MVSRIWMIQHLFMSNDWCQSENRDKREMLQSKKCEKPRNETPLQVSARISAFANMCALLLGRIKIKRQRIRWAVITCLCNTLIATHCFPLYDRTWTELNKWVRLCWLLPLRTAAACNTFVVVVVILSARLLHHGSKWICAYPRFFTIFPFRRFFRMLFPPNATDMGTADCGSQIKKRKRCQKKS